MKKKLPDEELLLTPEEVKALPEPLQNIRNCWIDAIQDLETQHPNADDGKSTNQLLDMLSACIIFDTTVRGMFLKKGTDSM